MDDRASTRRPGAWLFLAALTALLAWGCEVENAVVKADAETHQGTTPDTEGAEVDGTAVDDGALPLFELSISPAAQGLLDEDLYADVEVPAALVVDDQRWEIEVEYQGASSRKYDKKSYRLKFTGNDPFRADAAWFESGSDGDVAANRLGGGTPDAYRRLVLRAMVIDKSLVREALAYDILRILGGHAPQVAFVNLALNGEERGLYVLEDPVNEDYLLRRGFEGDGALYKGVDQQADFKPGRNLQAGFEKKMEKDEPWDDLETLVERFQTTPTDIDAYRECIDALYPLDAHIARMIWVSYTQNGDTASQNFYLYAEPQEGDEMRVDEDAPRRWHMLAWDSDVCFSNHWSTDEELMPLDCRHLLDGRNNFGRRFVQVEELRHQLVDRFEALLATTLSADAVMPLAENLFARVEPSLQRDRELWNEEQNPQEEFDEIRTFIEERPVYLGEQLVLFREDPALVEEP